MLKKEKRNFMFLVDVSGSMQGCFAYSAVDVLKGALKRVKRTDTFNIVIFGTEVRYLCNVSVKGSWSNKRNAIRLVRNAEHLGGTDLKMAMEYAKSLMDNYRLCLYVIITDGEFFI